MLLEPRTRAEQAETLGLTQVDLEAKLAPLRTKLLAVRERRPSPLKDDKILTSWNGLMIAAYADGYRLTQDPRHRAAAEKAADFVLSKLRLPDGRLLRTYRDGRAKLPAYLEDYAFLAHGLLRLHAATGDSKRLTQAKALTDLMIEDFNDIKGGGFFYTADGHESLLARPKDPVDGVLPGGNSMAIRNLVALGVLTKEPRYLDLAGQSLSAFSGRLSQSPALLPWMLLGLQEYLDARPDAAEALAAPGVVDAPLQRDSRAVVAASAKRVGDDVTITLTIQKGWHIYANPTGVAAIPPSRLTLEPGQGMKLLSVDFPPGVPTLLDSSGKEKVSVYADTVVFKVRVGPDPAAKKPPAAPLKFRLRCQACDERACLAPADMIVECE